MAAYYSNATSAYKLDTSSHHTSRKGQVVDTHALMSQIYAAFNKRDIDGTLALMSEDVNWPKASEAAAS
jgi:hypothetical protein